ncbi:nitroreductase family protein [Nakamurella sp. PAMC28650]|uniref:nitroreductase family protein n=1 Tax=Nakamurella sp. PAMC28650 TaxID=2762325 RepID=UPI00164D2AF4|nr:nitroreductase family protein [Nakamurella sp. PAMC28650]QNK82207.1 nitroreductase family protein [Nakamurella sp. PAMC28650]
MELTDAMRTTGTCRYFSDQEVPDDVLYRAFDSARFGPQGGNRQPVRWIVVRDPGLKKAMADLYLPPWKAYFEGISGGDVRVGALPKTVTAADDFAEHLAEVPAIIVLCAEVSGLHPTDTGLDRLSVVGGASIYPTMQNLCLALREQGVATAVTTLLCIEEVKIAEMLDIPKGFITAAHIAVGYPTNSFPTKLTRSPVQDIVSLDRFGAIMFDDEAVAKATAPSDLVAAG